MRQELENILPNEVESIKAALLTARLSELPDGTRSMIDYAIRIIEYRRRGQAENDRRAVLRFSEECDQYGAD